MKIGFLKADVEGFGLHVLQGSLLSVLKYRPVISLSVYHNWGELFGIPEIIQNLPNYVYSFQMGTYTNPPTFEEMIIFAWPKEVFSPN